MKTKRHKGKQDASLPEEDNPPKDTTATTTQDDTASRVATKSRMRQELQTLHQELEIAEYAKSHNGQYRKKVPRQESMRRTKKRKILEKGDVQEFAMVGGDESRLRGSKVAIQSQIIQGSQVFGVVQPQEEEEEQVLQPALKLAAMDEEDDEEEYDFEDPEEEDSDDDQAEVIDVDDDEDDDPKRDILIENEDDDEVLDAEEDDDENGDEEEDDQPAGPTESTKATTATKLHPKKAKRRMYRLKNFQSQRMAERHGEALAAHARGQPKVAIEMLQQVAKDAPSAPQVYSSLGMVYEDMLQACKRRYRPNEGSPMKGERETAEESTPAGEATTDSGADVEEGTKVDEMTPDPALAEQLNLARKAYGSYHVAAILCKRDFTLWVRSGDMASDIAQIHGEVMALPSASIHVRRHHRSEKRRWQSEALRDYIVADNLKPPGIDVPAKLAAMHIELGNLSDALTILTDLKNRPSTTEGARSEFQSSYKAWLLYADLMLRIGHECAQWNRGIHTNNNYMFRRWLRKLSTVFDWQGRRLQALSLAFEAAAGSCSTERFMIWTQERAMAKTNAVEEELEKRRWHLDTDDKVLEQHVDAIGGEIDNNGLATMLVEVGESVVRDRGSPTSADSMDGTPANGDISSDTTIQGQIGGKEADKSTPSSELTGQEHFEQEKGLLLDRNSVELEEFDKTTDDMDLKLGTTAGKDRQKARTALVNRHRSSVVTLVGEYHQQTSDSQPTETAQLEGEDRFIGRYEHPLSISASCRTVCAIASELLKHLLGLELYKGGRLVGEAVSVYLKERAALRDKRVATRRRYEEYQDNAQRSLLHFEDYDEANNEASDDEDFGAFLSDDDDLDENEHNGVLDSLRTGALPPEIRVLFALALIGEGGRNFVATKCSEAIADLEEEGKQWFSEGALDTELADDPSWSLFRRAMTEPLGRTGAYSFVTDVLRKTGKEQEWSSHFLPLFRRQLNNMESIGLTDDLLRLRGDLTPFQSFRKIALLKIFVAASRFKIHQVELLSSTDKGVVQTTVDSVGTVLKLATSTIETLSKLFHLVWKVEADGALPPMSLEVVRIVGRCYRWLSNEGSTSIAYSALTELVSCSTRIVSFLGGHPVPGFREGATIDNLDNFTWSGFPLKSSWQPDEYRAISLRAYNLCVGCNVSLFSGWEPEEFTLSLLRRRHENKHFGVHIDEGRIAGYLSHECEREIARQWTEIAKLLPALPSFGFLEHLAGVKQKDWYKKEIEDRKENTTNAPIAMYGEEDGIQVYLAFSSLCIQLASTSCNRNVWNQLVQAALSVLMPVSQFVLDFQFWDSDIGEAAASLSGFDEWQHLSETGRDADKMFPFGKRPAMRRKRATKTIERMVKEWIEGSNKPTLQRIVIISVDELNSLWKQGDDNCKNEEASEKGMECMRNLHIATKQLRACFTGMAVEKASLQVAVALLELASQPSCRNPFLCLQQAAMYASQGSKAGNSDIIFRQGLPESKFCTPLEAMIILGRADCLHSVYFPNEAAFLCSYVARVCSLHRDKERPEMEWNAQWKIAAIYAYNVSVMIRSTVSTVLDKDMQKSFLNMWDRDVVEELERGRADGAAWKRAILRGTGKPPLHPDDSGNGKMLLADNEEAEEIEGEIEEDDEEEEEEEPQSFEDNDEDVEENDEDDVDGDEGEEERDNVAENNNGDGSEADSDDSDDDDDDEDDSLNDKAGCVASSEQYRGPPHADSFAISYDKSGMHSSQEAATSEDDSDDDSMENVEIVGV